MSGKILILIATMSGTAEMVADEVLSRIEDAGREGRILRMEKASVDTLRAAGELILCSSTYGTGDVPDNGQALYAALQTERPDLSHLRYGVVSLGDSTYPLTFCFGGKKFDELLAELGAIRVCDRVEHDRRGRDYPEDLAGDWTEIWLERVNA